MPFIRALAWTDTMTAPRDACINCREREWGQARRAGGQGSDREELALPQRSLGRLYAAHGDRVDDLEHQPRDQRHRRQRRARLSSAGGVSTGGGRFGSPRRRRRFSQIIIITG